MKNEIEILIAKQLPVEIGPIIFHALAEDRMLFTNRSTAWEMDVIPKRGPRWQAIQEQIAAYNAYVKMLEEKTGFDRFFAGNGFCVSRQQVSDSFGEAFASAVFDMPDYPFQTELTIRGDYLMQKEYAPLYRIEVPGFGETQFEIDKLCNTYSANMNIHNILLWNWADDERDLTYSLYNHFERAGLIELENEEKSYYNYESYDQHRDNMTAPDKNLLRCMEVMESMGYLTRYKIRPKTDTPWFVFRREGAYGVVATLDYRFKQDALLMEKLRLILAQPEEEVEVFRYFLTDCNGKQYLSDNSGKLGGHRRLKIYGKLDCASAKRHIAKGDYVRHRVFFADEETAVAAGYRPCGICMRERYLEWKTIHSKAGEKGDGLHGTI